MLYVCKALWPVLYLFYGHIACLNTEALETSYFLLNAFSSLSYLHSDFTFTKATR